MKVITKSCRLKCVTHDSANLVVRLRLLKLQVLSKIFKISQQFSTLVAIESLRVIDCKEKKPIRHSLLRREDIFLDVVLGGLVDDLLKEEVRCDG